MHVVELVQLATLLAQHGPLYAAQRTRPAREALDDYWTASKCRIDRWQRSLKGLSLAAACPEQLESAAARRLVEEILASEALVRGFAGAMQLAARRTGDADGVTIARSILLAQMEATHRVLRLILNSASVPLPAAFAFNRLRRRAELWCDLIVGRLCAEHDVSDQGCEPERARRVGRTLREEGLELWQPLAATISAGLAGALDPAALNPDLNARIAAAVLAALPDEARDSYGLLRSGLLARLGQTADDTQTLLGEWLDVLPRRPEGSDFVSGEPPPEARSRWRLRD